MKNTIIILISLLLSSTFILADDHIVKPEEISKSDVAGAMYVRPSMTKTTHEDGSIALDVTSFLSTDGKYETGMYRSAASHINVNEPWGVDEFFFVIQGSITLTSKDGSVLTIEVGEGASIPKEWTGKWDTDGYSKIWAIYYGDSKE